jgi:hypothetical protein
MTAKAADRPMSSRVAMPPDKTIPPHGVVVKGNLQINELTLRQRNAMNDKPLDEYEARRVGYPEIEIAHECPKAIATQ